MKVGATGSLEQEFSFGGSNVDFLQSMVASKDNTLLLSGHSNSLQSGVKSQSALGVFDYWVLKVNASGSVLWDKTYGGTGQEELSSVIALWDGSYVLGGISLSGVSGDKTEASRGNFDCWLVRIDEFGHKLWDRSLGGDNTEYLAQLLPSPEGGFFVGASSYSSSGGDKFSNSQTGDYWLSKYNVGGTRFCIQL